MSHNSRELQILEHIDPGTGGIVGFENTSAGYIRAICLTSDGDVPTALNGQTGFASGCDLVDLYATNGKRYINVGDKDSSNWDEVRTRDTANGTETGFGGNEAGIQFGDDQTIAMGAGSDFQLLWSDADASNHAAVIAIGDTSQSLHITDVGAKATDWNISTNTHPNVYIHSNTTPATDYLRIGDHDGTEADIDVVGGTSLALKIAGTEYASLRVTGLAVGTYVVAGTEAGTDQLTLQSTGTAPSGTGANVGHLYADYESDDDELFWLSGTGGTATQLTT